MAECECLPKCLFFNDRIADSSAAASLMKSGIALATLSRKK
jgi:hypothetical protein